MFQNIGFTELIIILVVALLVFGPQKLPEMGKAIGSAVTEFKKGLSGISAEAVEEKKKELLKAQEAKPIESVKNDSAGPSNPAG